MPDGYLEWSGGVQNMTVNPSVYPSLTDKITIALWAFGDSAMLPANTTILEGVNAANQRQVNIHFPWSDSRIYWDCGGDASGYDRIDQAASVDEIRGKWNFWAFTKNAGTGVMSIFKNGHLWTSGSGKTRPIDIRKWLLGCDANGSGLHYYGKMDELSIWNKDLDSNAIQQIMMNDISSSHPDYDSLLAYYSFNDGSGFTAADSGPHSYPSQLVNPGWRSFRGYELHRNFVLGDLRPNTTFIQGVYDTTYIQQFPIYDSTLNLATSVISYAVSNNNLSVQDTIYVWPAGYTYVFDPLGNVLDSVFIAGQDTLSVFPLTYYQRRPMRVELINFITPYGINLNLNGLTGRTWTYDVTDYARVLKGPRFMAMSDGAYQEDNDITFIYYEGTPPRTVHSLSQIWPSGSWVVPSYNDIVNNVYFEPRQVTLSPAAAQFKIRSAISGHGQEGEFIPRIHTISVNDSIKYLRQVWKACATNPIYPQGGTWVYDRAGWCPGAVVDNKDFELTSKVTPGHTITIDYSLPYIMNPGSSNYRVNNQLVSYGPANFTLDAAVEYIKSPSDRTEYMRLNPLCNQPLVAIKNTGSTPLTSVDITYGRVGAPLSTFHWTGNLNFLQLAELSLPAPDWDGSSSDRFIMYVSQPNGGNDQYALNDTLYSKFVVPPVYPTHLFFELKTNLYAYEDSYILKNADGDTIIYRHNLTSNTMYRDTVELPYGCYTLLMTDNGDDGLSFWANPDQGSGYFRIFDSKNPMILKTFNPDFGNNIYLQFRTNTAANVPDIQPVAINNLEVYPNPSSGSFDVELSMPLNSLVTLEVLNVTGQVVIKETVRVSQVPEKVTINGDQFENGVYFVQAGSGNKQVTRKMVIGK
ncbi:MAG: peptide-N-glycosidase F-related protein [Bacteroidetes bacterium]|nr:peptide-N-glycosidase F-related protein [Bacteroidota bacterium]